MGRIEAIVGNEHPLKLIAENMVKHFKSRNSKLEIKAMIVCISRRISVALYEKIVKVRPEWHSNNDRLIS